MPPVSGRRRARKEPDATHADSGEGAVETPTRKRRKVNGEAKDTGTPGSRRSTRDAAGTGNGSPLKNNLKRASSADTEGTVEDQVNDVEAEEQALYNLADDIVRNLRVATYSIGAETDFNNAIVDKSAQAFAKIAGREWTYYVSKLKVVFGRPNRDSKRASVSSPASNTPRPLADMAVDIDLGPDQQVSRLHAEIAFDQQDQRWFIHANGRNGLNLDNQKINPGQRAWLHSGCVIGIIGTQMIFMLPGTPPVIHPEIRRQLLPEYDEESEHDRRENRHLGPGLGRGRGRGAFHAPEPTHTAGNLPGGQQYQYGPQEPPQLPGTPLGKFKDALVPKTKPSPTYGRGVMLESTEDIDYSVDSNKDIKPPHSYAAMIGQAILSTPEENATLARIYEFIKDKYAYFRFNGGGWQNSIRHNLSLSKCFEKIPRRTDEPGKGMKWQIVPEFREEFMKKNIQPAGSARRRTLNSSMPTSPATAQLSSGGATAQTERLMGVIGETRDGSETPDIGGVDSYTPERGASSFLAGGSLSNSRHPDVQATPSTISKSERVTPLFDRSSGPVRFSLPNDPITRESRQAVLNLTSPPSMNNVSSTGYDALLSVPGSSSNLFTPLPRNRLPSLVPATGLQSTCKIPSFYAKDLLSSPAPFWKFVDIGSGNTAQARLPEESPIRSPSKEHDEDEDDGMPVESSPVKKGQYVAVSSPPGVPVATSQTDPDEMDEDDKDDDEHDKDQTISPARTASRPMSSHRPQELHEDDSIVLGARPEIKLEPDVAAINGNANEPTTPIKRSDTQSPIKLTNGSSFQQNGLGAKPNPFSRVQQLVEDDEEDEIDLARGFEKIGSYHRSMHMQQNTGLPTTAPTQSGAVGVGMMGMR